MTNSKMTYVDALNAVLNGEPMTDAVAEKLTALRDSVAKRNSHKSGKPTKAQLANAEIGEKIINAMEVGVDYTCTDIGKLMGGLSSQKVSPIMKALLDGGRVTCEKVKGGKLVYRLA